MTQVFGTFTLSDAEGLDGLTIRRLATELGVTPMALYWHYRSKEELLAGLADRVWAEIDTEVDQAAAWPQQLRGLMESLLRVLREYPSASTLLLSGEKRNSEAALVATETTLDVLRRAGFSRDRAAAIARSALWTALMLVMGEPGFEPGITEADRAEMQRQNRVRLALLPPGRYPRVVEAVGPLTACDPDLHYEFGVTSSSPACRRSPGRCRRDTCVVKPASPNAGNPRCSWPPS